MAYTPTEWKCGDVVTAEKLNNIEEGIQEALQGGGGLDILIAEMTYDDNTGNFTCALSKTEIQQAFDNGKCVVAHCLYKDNSQEVVVAFYAPMSVYTGSIYFRADNSIYFNSSYAADQYTYIYQQ